MSDRWLYAWGLAAVGFGGASLIVPLYVVALGGGPALLGLLFATSSFVGVPAALGIGVLADRTGRRRAFVLAATATSAAMLLVVPAVDDVGLVVLATAVLWFAYAAAVPVVTLLAVVGAADGQWSDRIARLSRFQGLGWTLGLAMGVVVTAVGSFLADPLPAQRAFFLVCAACGLLGFVVGLRTLPPDPRTAAAPSPSPRKLRRRLRTAGRYSIRGAAFPFTLALTDTRRLHPRRLVSRFTPTLGLFFVAVLLAFTGFGVFFAPLPAYLTDAGVGSSGVFGLYLVLNAGAVAYFAGAAGLAGRYDAAAVHAGGLFARGLAFPAVALAGSVVADAALRLAITGGLFVGLGLTWAVIAVTAGTLVTTLAPAGVRGEALGLYSAVSALAGGIGGLLGGWLGAMSYLVAFGTAGGFVVAASLVGLLLFRRRAAAAPASTAPSP